MIDKALKPRFLKIRRSANSIRPGTPMPRREAPHVAEKTLHLHFAIPTADHEAVEEEIEETGQLREQLLAFPFVSDCWRCQDKRQVGVKFQVTAPADGYDQLLSSAFQQLGAVLEESELLRREGATWRATYENGALADEGAFTPAVATEATTSRGG